MESASASLNRNSLAVVSVDLCFRFRQISLVRACHLVCLSLSFGISEHARRMCLLRKTASYSICYTIMVVLYVEYKNINMAFNCK
jgi:hypothetical protein